MQTIILCGGEGTRLKEETEYKPKPMVPIGKKPILWHVMQTYARYGFTDFILALGFKGDVIRDYFLNFKYYNNDLTLDLSDHKSIRFLGKSQDTPNWNVTFVETGEHSMTGYRVKMCEKYIKNDLFFLTYGDGVADINIRQLLTFHKRHGKIGTLTGVTPPSRWGELVIKDHDLVTSFMEKVKPGGADHLVSGGFFVFHRKFFKYLPANEKTVMEDKPFKKLARDRQFVVYRHDGFWQCMDTYRDYLMLNRLWDKGNTPWIKGKK